MEECAAIYDVSHDVACMFDKTLQISVVLKDGEFTRFFCIRRCKNAAKYMTLAHTTPEPSKNKVWQIFDPSA